MKKNYIAPEMDMLEVEVQPVCLSEYDEEADPSTPLAKRFDSIFDDTDELAIED